MPVYSAYARLFGCRCHPDFWALANVKIKWAYARLFGICPFIWNMPVYLDFLPHMPVYLDFLPHVPIYWEIYPIVSYLIKFSQLFSGGDHCDIGAGLLCAYWHATYPGVLRRGCSSEVVIALVRRNS